MTEAGRRARGARRAARVLARALVVVGALVAAVFVVVLAYLRTPQGRRWVRDRVESEVSSAIAGSLEIGELTNVWPGDVRARGVVFRDADGARVLEIDRAAIALDATKLLRRRLVFRSANVDGARLSLAEHGGKLRIERAFSRGGAPSRGGGRSLDIELENIHVERVRLAVKPAQGPRLVFEGVKGSVSIRREPGEAVRVRLDDVSAKLAKTARIVPDVHIEGLHGDIRAKETEAVHLEFGGTVEGDRMRGTFRYFPHRKPSTNLDLDVPDPSLRTRILSLGLGAVDRASPSVRVERSIKGRFRQWRESRER